MKTMKEQTKNAVWIILGIAALVITLSMTGCGQGPQGATGDTGAQGATGAPGAAAPAPSPAPSESAVQQLVDDQNAERATLGQEPLTAGLTCSLYTVPTTTTGITAAANGGTAPVLTSVGSFEYLGVFNEPNGPVTAGLNILPTALQGVYQTWYIVKCTGNLVVGDSNWHEFDIDSDDGSNLYVDGLIINNDGLHGAQDKSASKFLAYGFHSFELDYLQGAGQEALILNEDSAIMQATGFYH